MRVKNTSSQQFVAIVLLAGSTLIAGCGRDSDEATTQGPKQAPTKVELDALELPQANAGIGITLSSVPVDHVVTFNESEWIQITDQWNPAVVYSIVRSTELDPGQTPATPGDFERRVLASPEGKVLDRGRVETALGPADWISGSYLDDDGPVEDLHLFAPHPSRPGTVIVTCLAPLGDKSVEDRIAVILELLSNAS